MLLALALGCASLLGPPRASGQATKDGKPPETVTLEFEETSPVAGTARVSVWGEAFAGPHPIVTPDTPTADAEAIRSAWGATWKAYNWNLHPDPWSKEFPGARSWVENYAGQVVLALRSSRQTLRCRIRLTQPAKGLRGGGSGECQLSGGGDIALTLGS